MTTPDLNIVMPYGVTMEGDGTTYAKIPKNHPKRLNPSRFALPNLQPCRVSASWAENPNPVDVNLYNGNRFVRTLATIQAGGGSVMVALGTRDGDFIQLLGNRNTPIPTGTTGTLEIYPLNFE